MAFGITDLKKGTIFQMEGVPYKVLDYNQKVVGRGGSIVNLRIKSIIDGKVLSTTFKGNESIEPADVSSKTVQYLYNDGSNYFFMDNDNFDQFEVPADMVSDQSGYMKEGDTIQVQLYDGHPINVELPKNVYLTVTYAESVVKGDTTSSVLKDAKVETGITVKVPSFIKQGDIISVDTSNGAYRERKKD